MEKELTILKDQLRKKDLQEMEHKKAIYRFESIIAQMEM